MKIHSKFHHRSFSIKLWIIVFAILLSLSALVIAFLIIEGKNNGIKETTLRVQGSSVDTPSTLSVKPKDKELTYTSPTFEASYTFNAIAPHWKESGASEDNREVFIRISQDAKDWSDWTPVEAMRPQRDDAPHADEVFPETPIITLGKYFEYKVELKRIDDRSPEIKDLSITYFNSEPSKLSKISSSLRSLFDGQTADAATALPDIISREAWGNPDPTGNAYRTTNEHWFPSYSPTKQIFIHHTVNSNYESATDGASVVRAIWQYHAKTLGWGDIGYNYLVDQSGKTYQGRAHGDNVTAGHVYNYNEGSMGVALIGCFEPNSSTCEQLNQNDQPPSGPMLESLSSILAWSATKFEIDPLAQHSFCMSDGTGCLNLHTISGHKDASVTSCPGALVYEDLQAIRNSVATKMNNKYTYAAKQVDYPYVNLGDNNEASVTMQFKNTGTATWQNSGINPIRLATANNRDHSSAFRTNSWLSESRPAALNEPSVAPGQIGTFTFTILNPAKYTDYWHEYVGLVAEGSAHFGSYHGILINTRSYTYTHSSQGAYTDSSKTSSVDLNSLSPSQSAWFVLKLVNTSNVTWSNTGSYPVWLGTDNARDRKSRYCTSTWNGCNRATRLQESSVAPGAVATFEFPITVPAGGGTFSEHFTPVVEGTAWMEPSGMPFTTKVNSNYAWSYAGQSYYTDSTKTMTVDVNNLSPGQTFFFSVSAKNTGDTTWYNAGRHPIRLGTSRGHDRTSAFRTNSWAGQNRLSSIKESSVAPGQTATFEGTLVAPTGGSYKEYFQPVVENITWLNDVGLYIPATVKGTYSWSFAGQQAYTDASLSSLVDTSRLAKGQRFYFVVSTKNTGNTTWYKSSRYPVRLGTSREHDRTSVFYDSSWISINRPSGLLEDSVKPGTVGRLGGYFTAPGNAGTYKEYLQPVAENITWLNDLGLYIPATVKD